MAKPKHRCAIKGCTTGRGGDQIMCRTHWFMVPKALRDRVWHTYKTAQGSEQHLRAIAESIRHVNDLLDEKLINT